SRRSRRRDTHRSPRPTAAHAPALAHPKKVEGVASALRNAQGEWAIRDLPDGLVRRSADSPLRSGIPLKCLLKERSIMSVEAASLSRTVSAMRPMVPAKDFEISKRFYIELGFQPRPLTDRLVEMQLGVFSFILQPYYVREWADNFAVHVTVSDVGLWWD